jgi:hypothetical protein
MYYVCPNIIIPLTQPKKLSYSELAGPRNLDWFVSHFWGIPFAEFCRTIQKHSLGEGDAIAAHESDMNIKNGLDRCVEANAAASEGLRGSIMPNPSFSDNGRAETAYWICTFSNNQFELGKELGTKWDESSFYKALNSGLVKGTLMILDLDVSPLKRSWCIFELLQTFQLSEFHQGDFAGLLLGTDAGILNYGNAGMDMIVAVASSISKLSLEDATATSEDDKNMIDSLVKSQSGGYEAVNEFVKSKVVTILEGVEKNFHKTVSQMKNELSGKTPAEEEQESKEEEENGQGGEGKHPGPQGISV